MAIRLAGLRKAFGENVVLTGLSCEFPERGVVALTGPSGSGKTTLLNLMLGLIKPDSGRIEGVTSIGAVFQEDRLVERMSAFENLRLISNDAARIERHLAAVELAGFADVPVSTLSGGMKRRVAIARGALFPCDALLLDEPFQGLDADVRAKVAAYLLDTCRDRLMVLVTHDPQEIELMGASETIPLRGRGGA